MVSLRQGAPINIQLGIIKHYAKKDAKRRTA
jgi:hypothetical protein